MVVIVVDGDDVDDDDDDDDDDDIVVVVVVLVVFVVVIQNTNYVYRCTGTLQTTKFNKRFADSLFQNQTGFSL